MKRTRETRGMITRTFFVKKAEVLVFNKNSGGLETVNIEKISNTEPILNSKTISTPDITFLRVISETTELRLYAMSPEDFVKYATVIKEEREEE